MSTRSASFMGLGDLVQKAMYLGIGVASYAGEKAGEKLSELRVQVQKVADEMVDRGEMNADEARRFVDEMVKRAQQSAPTTSVPEQRPTEPRKIEILDDEEPAPTQTAVDDMRQQVADLQEELRRLKKN
ncbi:phasin family protein [Leptolyngbya sp. FACHB-17]|uniref:phasin family protein n=1 Tax=unclassified Leptolyngbya TaxID=2650499 RepID=UPI001F55817F|nr:phasin family protein [Leptolyngbya sp. FACHB-17]